MITQETLNNFMAEKGLDYQVIKLPVPNVLNPQRHTGFYATYRSDSNTMLGCGMTKQYEVFQNVPTFTNIITDLLKHQDMELVNGGVWKGGNKAFLSVKLGDINLGDGDVIQKHLNIILTHDGSSAVNFFLTPFRVFCANQLNMLHRYSRENDGSKFRVLHSQNGLRIIGNLEKELQIWDGKFQQVEKTYSKLKSTKINKMHIIKVLEKLFPRFGELDVENKRVSKAHTIASNTIEKIATQFNDADGGRSEVNTAWNLYNSIQGVFQHQPTKLTDNHEQSVMTGSIHKRSYEALNIINKTIQESHSFEDYQVNAEIEEMIGGFSLV